MCAAERAAEPWLERGQAETLYNQVLVESEFLGVAAHVSLSCIDRMHDRCIKCIG